MKVANLLETAHESFRQAALRYQQELIDAGVEDVKLITPSRSLLKDAVEENGMRGIIASIALELVDPKLNNAVLLLSQRPTTNKYDLYHVYTDGWSLSAQSMVDHILRWVASGGLKEDAAEPSASTKLHRFAKELQAHGFEAEVSNKAPSSSINSSKLGIEVSGYGVKDFIKLYRPLWRWEADAGYFADVKHEQRFRSVREMVDKLQQFYRRLPKCLEYNKALVK